MIKDLKGLSFKKVRFVLGLFAAIVILVSVIIMSFDKEGLELQKFSDRFLGLIYQGKYTEAYQCVDSSRIKIEELKEVSELTSHYSLGAVYLEIGEPLCKIGFKPITLDKDQNNDEPLEFWIVNMNGDWKVISVYSTLGEATL